MGPNVIQLVRCRSCSSPSLTSVCDYCQAEAALCASASWRSRERRIWAVLVLGVGAAALVLWGWGPGA